MPGGRSCSSACLGVGSVLSGWLDVCGVSSTTPAAPSQQQDAVLELPTTCRVRLCSVSCTVFSLWCFSGSSGSKKKKKTTPPIAWEHRGMGLSPGGGQVEALLGDSSLRMPQGSCSPAAGLTEQPVPVSVWGALWPQPIACCSVMLRLLPCSMPAAESRFGEITPSVPRASATRCLSPGW